MNFATTAKTSGPGFDPIAAVRAIAKDLPLFPSRPNLLRSPADPPPPDDYMVVIPNSKSDTGAIYNMGGRIVTGSVPAESDTHEVEAAEPDSEGEERQPQEESTE